MGKLTRVASESELKQKKTPSTQTIVSTEEQKKKTCCNRFDVVSVLVFLKRERERQGDGKRETDEEKEVKKLLVKCLCSFIENCK